MSAGAAVLAIWAALLVGWYAARWWIYEKDEIAAGQRHDRAKAVMWAARRVLAVAVIIGVVLVGLWFRGKGR
jgi:hypothetical protein